MKVTSVKGFRDLLPPEAARRRRILRVSVALLEAYGFKEMELPLLEKVELFQRSVGADSDIVEKEMYCFEDKDGSWLALRPEGTASLVRAYVESGMTRSHPEAKLYYLGPMFRRERPQKGRYRQFSQIGAECLGRDDAAADAETVTLAADICEAAGMQDYRIEINSLGDSVCRPAYRDVLTGFARERVGSLCADCRSRLERNPLRLLDCKLEGCRDAMQGAPLMIDGLCDDCAAHHHRVLDLLGAAGVEVDANPYMVRGLDYYCRTAFEIRSSRLGSQDSVGGGGRYDGLVSALGGGDVAGVGFAFGVERMLLAVEEQADLGDSPDLVVAPMGEEAMVEAMRLARKLRRHGVCVEIENPKRKLKTQMKRADRVGAHYVVILGQTELETRRASLRDMKNKADFECAVALDAAAEQIMETIRGAGKGGA